MAKHRALIIGAGRIGSGFGWMPTSYVYTHADAYLALKDRVELVGFVEPDPGRLECAGAKYGGSDGFKTFRTLEPALAELKPDVVSICTQPAERAVPLALCNQIAGIRYFWCEKPLALLDVPIDTHIQVNYWRRFEPMHRQIKDKLEAGDYGEIVRLVVCAKRDVHTVCHFTDLALWWGVSPAKFTYCDVPASDFTTCEYTLYTTTRVLRFKAGGALMAVDEGYRSTIFPGMRLPLCKRSKGWSPIFMTEALSNLMDAMEGIAPLKSPPAGAIEAEAWADEILNPPLLYKYKTYISGTNIASGSYTPFTGYP